MNKFVALTFVCLCLLADSYRVVDAGLTPPDVGDDKSSRSTANISTTTTTSTTTTSTTTAAVEDRIAPSTTALLIVFSFIAVACIIVAVILIMRKRKHDRGNERSATSPSIGPPECTVLPGDTSIYAEVALTQSPTYSNTIGSSVQSAGRAVDMGHNVLYAEIDLPPSKDQPSLKKGTEYLCPIYSEPYETPATDNSTLYAEPFNPVKTPKAALPARNQLATAAAGQWDIYSLAKAIPTSDPKAIYTELTKL